ncbi:MAG TPA: histidine phosphatase family protein [Myxococcota bacterium]|nr:histidine phosphatase family protein [Myxococcota bacterium]
MTRLFVIRHGETDGNKNKIYRGRWDLPLNEKGLAQVEKAGAALETVRLDAILTSPLERTCQTAAAVARFQKIEPQTEPALIDIDYGQWTRLLDSEVARKHPDIYARWKQRPETVVFPDGEGLADVRRRVESLLAGLGEEYPGQNVALCGHRVSVKMILMVALGLTDSAFWKILVDTASISVIGLDDGAFSLVFANDTCHLKPLADKFKAADF